MLFEFQLGHTAIEAHRNICNAKGADAISYATTTRWFKRFEYGNYSLKDKQRPGSPLIINLNELKHALDSVPCQSTRDLEKNTGLAKTTIHYHLKRLGLVPKLGGWIPHELTPAQKKKRVELCHN